MRCDAVVDSGLSPVARFWRLEFEAVRYDARVLVRLTSHIASYSPYPSSIVERSFYTRASRHLHVSPLMAVSGRRHPSGPTSRLSVPPSLSAFARAEWSQFLSCIFDGQHKRK